MDISFYDSYKWSFFNLTRENDKNVFAVNKLYVEIAGDLTAGILLGQIVFWNLPDEKRLKPTKLRVIKYDHRTKRKEYWLAKKKVDWWDEIRLTARQVAWAERKLISKGIIRTKIYRFDNIPTTHYQLTEYFFDTYLGICTGNKNFLYK